LQACDDAVRIHKKTGIEDGGVNLELGNESGVFVIGDHCCNIACKTVTSPANIGHNTKCDEGFASPAKNEEIERCKTYDGLNTQDGRNQELRVNWFANNDLSGNMDNDGANDQEGRKLEKEVNQFINDGLIDNNECERDVSLEENQECLDNATDAENMVAADNVPGMIEAKESCVEYVPGMTSLPNGEESV
jgi:hypothetical protein